MSPVFSARRRAEEFDSLVEGTSTRQVDARHDEFLAIVAALRDMPEAQPRAAFTAALRERLMVAAETELVPADEARLTLPTRRPRDRRIAVAVGGFAIVGATTSMAMAAQSALPGDVLYPLKRAIENVQTGISADEGARGATLLASAEGRLEEVRALSTENQPEDVEAIADTLNSFIEQATAASDLMLADYAQSGQPDTITKLLAFTTSSIKALSALESMIPAEARDELMRAAQVLEMIGSEAVEVCPDCPGSALFEIPANLVSVAEKGLAETTAGAAVAIAKSTRIKPRKQPARSGDDSTSTGEGAATLPGEEVLTAGEAPAPPADGEKKSGDKQSGGPISQLTDGLTQGDSQSTSGEVPDLGEVVDEVTNGVGEVVDGLTGKKSGDLGQK